MKRVYYFLLFTIIILANSQVVAQTDVNVIAKNLKLKSQQEAFASGDDLFRSTETETELPAELQQDVLKGSILKINDARKAELQEESPSLLTVSLKNADGQILDLKLFKADFFGDDFQINLASGTPFASHKGVHYWGIVNDRENSLAAISIGETGVMGFIVDGNLNYTLGKINNESEDYILYANQDFQVANPFGCDVDPNQHVKEGPQFQTEAENPDNCVQMYVEIDNDMVVAKGGVTPATDYVLGAFSQVAILYANESIDFTVKEIFAWDTEDPYTGPSTSDYLYAFRDHLNGNYNGDLAHLVGTNGGGGIAYVDVLCNSLYGVGYSDINLSYSQVPNYSWTVEVLTHEIGHNLGSRHTHDCVWNGNNTAIDGCGPAAGYSSGCDGPLPASGTIMSYCHLVSGVGIDFNLGFGPQPGDLIRNRVYNSTCLVACSAPTVDDAGISAIIAPAGTICATETDPVVTLENFGTNTLTSVTIEYQLDNNTVNSYAWSGALASGVATSVTLPPITFSNGSHTFNANTLNPNGVTDEDPSNDAASSTFTSQALQIFYADNDGDGYGDPNNTILDCTAPAGYVGNADDCNDTDGSIYPGGVCDDGDPCTENDVYDSNCNCTGTSVGDSDGDGVCDALDVCPGGDDTIDSDGDGTPDFCDCNPATGNFPQNPLAHSGSGSANTSFTFVTGDKDPSFSIFGLDAKTNGNPRNRYEELATVTYVDESGNTINHGSYNGAFTSSATINISGPVQSITVSLEDALGGSTRLLEISFSPIDYCSGAPSCPDADNDGICDSEDVCPGFDDNLIGSNCDDGDVCTVNDTYTSNCVCEGTYTDSDGDGVCDGNDICAGGDDNIDSDGDGIPDFCDPSNCGNTITSTFSPDPLTHSGPGNSTSSVTFPTGNVDVDFVVNGLDAVTNGKPDGRYIEEVTVNYVDGTGSVQFYGTFNGGQQSSVNVSIPGAVQSVTLALADAYDGNSSTVMSVDPTDVTSCVNSSPITGNTEVAGKVAVFPNPTSDDFSITFGQKLENGTVEVFDYVGKRIAFFNINNEYSLELSTVDWTTSGQFYLVKITGLEDLPVIKKVMIIK